MSFPKDELPAPPEAREDARSFELLRLWFAGGAPSAVARTALWPDPAAWGIVLAEAARHVARSYAADGDAAGADAALARLRTGFDEELGARAPEDPFAGLHDG